MKRHARNRMALMVILLTGASHAGKTFLAQKILEKYSYPYLSLDHLKMGLIRSGQTGLAPEDDDELTAYLWPIAAEIIKTVIENDQHLVVEGCYVASDWHRHFDEKYLDHIKACCLIMSEKYILQNFSLIQQYANIIEHRINDDFDDMEKILAENRQYLRLARKGHMDILWIDKKYDSDLLLSNFHKIIYQGL